MNEIKFVKFGSLEGKKCIEKKFPGIKESDLVYIEDREGFGDTCIVEIIEDKEIGIVSIFDDIKYYREIGEEMLNAFDSISGFTIYSPVAVKKETAEKKVEENEVVDDDFEEVEITHKCGHKEIVEIKKTDDILEHLWLINAEETKLCPNCWEKEVKEKAKEAKKAGLPTLKGSAKQKKWAEIIRAEILEMLRSDPEAGAVAAWYAKNYTKASKWIDVKSMNEFELKRNMKQSMSEFEIKRNLKQLKKNMEMKLRCKR